MNTAGSIIAKHRKQCGMSQVELARLLSESLGFGISNKSVSKWEKDLADPGTRIFFELCRILEIRYPCEEYFGFRITDPMFYLNETGLERVREYASLLGYENRYRRIPSADPEASPDSSAVRRIPLQLYPVSAGPGVFLDEENYEEIQVDSHVSAAADFAVRVSGDSMEPLLHKNQIIYVHRQETLENGEIGIFFLKGEAFVKKLRLGEDGAALVSLNPKYVPIRIPEESDFRIFGRVVE